MDLLALGGFAFAASITPGPNNVMLWASGMNYGVRRTVPHMIGINLGFCSLLLLIALGLGSVIGAEPVVGTVIKVAGGVYLLRLAWRVATAGSAGPDLGSVDAEAAPTGTDGQPDEGVGRPMTFLEAATFQYLNPKAWVMGTTAAGMALPAGASLLSSVPLFVATFAVVNLPCITVWAGAGNLVGRLLADPRWRRGVNGALGALLAASVVLFLV